MTDSSSGTVTEEPVAPDPGNSPPERWTAPLDEQQTTDLFGLVNNVAVDLPEPDDDDVAPAGGA